MRRGLVVMSLLLVGVCGVAHGARVPAGSGIDEPIGEWTSGRPAVYSGSVIGWYAPPRWTTSARYVTDWLNRAQIGVRFTETSRQSAQLVIETDPQASCRARRGALRSGSGGATADGRGFASIGSDCRGVIARLMLAHEIGHALGLPHEYQRCSTMSPQFTILSKRFYTLARLQVQQLASGAIRWRVGPRTGLCRVRSITAQLYTPQDVAFLRQRFDG